MPKSPVARLTVAALALTAALAGAEGASAQPIQGGCRPANNDAALGGAVIGGVAGALLGSAVAGHHEKTAGAVVGGGMGAIAGAAIGSSQNQPCPEGYVAYQQGPPPPPPPAYGPPSRPGEFWYGAPQRIHDRIAFVRNRVLTVDQDGWLSPRERNRLMHRLDEISRQEDGMRYQDGGRLSPDHISQLNSELDDLSRRIHWDEYAAGRHDRYDDR